MNELDFSFPTQLILFLLALNVVRKVMEILDVLLAEPEPPEPPPHRGLPTNYREYVEDLYGKR